MTLPHSRSESSGQQTVLSWTELERRHEEVDRVFEQWLDGSSMTDFEPSSEDECMFLKLSEECPSLRSIQ